MSRVLLSVAAGFFLLLAFAVSRASAEDPPGAKLYATYCAACHGATGRNGSAPAIGSKEFVAANDDTKIAQLTSEGNVPQGMPAWGKAKGGTLSDDQIASVAAFLRVLATMPDTSAPAAPPAKAPAAPLVPTKLSLAQTANRFGEAVLSATLQDANGKPVKAATIAFSRATTWGVVMLGSARTDEQGSASLLLPVVPVNANEVEALFKGDSGFEASAGKLAVERSRPTTRASTGTGRASLSVKEPVLLPPEGSLITANPPLLPTVLFALVVLSVWSAYARVLSLILRIRSGGGPAGMMGPRRE
jgi:mono/diheme cytochrome c family protein